MNEDLLATAQVNLRIMGYTKVRQTWGEIQSKPEFNRLYFICDGEGYVEIESQKNYGTIGQFILLPAGKIQSFGTINENTYLKYWCHFDAKVGNNNLFDLIALPYVVSVKEYVQVTELFKKLLSYHHHEDLSSLFMIKSILFELLSLYISNATLSNKENYFKPVNQYNEKISDILYYIEKNLSRPLNNETLANVLHFHPNHFIRFFKASVGVSPMRYINKLRMEKAKKMLVTSYMSVTEIGEKVSYSNVFHFSKAFKQYMGYSPSEYRQHYLEYKAR